MAKKKKTSKGSSNSGNAVAVRLKKGKTTFEIMAMNAKEYKEGSAKLSDCLVDDNHVYKSNKTIASQSELLNAFGTDDVMECLKIIMDTGKAQVTVDQNRERTAQKRIEMMNEIHKMYLDPKTKKPHPITRIESAFNQVKGGIVVDPKISVLQQIQDLNLVKKLIDTGLSLIENEEYIESMEQEPKKNDEPVDWKKEKRRRNAMKNYGKNKW